MSATGTVTINRQPTKDEMELARLLHMTFTDHRDPACGISWKCQQCLDAAVIILQRFGKGGN